MKFKSYKDFSIAQKLTWFVLPLTALLIVVIGSLSIYIGKTALKSEIVNNLESVVEFKISKITDFHEKTLSNMIMLQGNKTFTDQLPLLLQDTASQEEKDRAMNALLVPLDVFKNTYHYSSVKLLNSEGVVIVSSNNGRTGGRLKDPDDTAYKNGKKDIFFSNVFEDGKMIKMNVTAPLLCSNELCAVIAIEIDMQPLYTLIQDTTGLGKSGETLIGKKTSSGALFLNPLRHDPSAAFRREAKSGSPSAKPVLEAVNGESASGVSKDYRGEEVIAVWSYIPTFNWGLVAKIDTDEVYEPINWLRNIIWIISLIALILTTILLTFFSNYIVKPLLDLQQVLHTLGEGKIVEGNLEKNGDDEIGSMIEATNSLSSFLTSIVTFTKDIGSGKFDSEANIDASSGDLGESLTNMSLNLQAIAQEDEKRNWATEGLAKFGDILRANDEELDVLADNILTNLVKYLDANQGGLFIVNDSEKEDVFLELVACYAWNKKKYINMRVDKGEGIVGQAWEENDTIYLTEVPKNFVKITSGLGNANPTCFLIIPLTVNDVTYGVIEIASFQEIDDHQKEFVEKLAESIASTLSTSKTNERTKHLLAQSQQQAEEMRAQEEEMRQNMEEMHATQEEMQRKEGEMTKIMEDLKVAQEQMKEQEEQMSKTMEETMMGMQQEMIDSEEKYKAEIEELKKKKD